MSSVHKKKRSAIIRLIFDYLINHKFTIFIALLMMIVSAGATGLHAWLVRPALDEVLIKGNKDMLLLIPIAIILVTLCKGLATYTHSYQMSKVAHSVIAKLQTQMFEKLMYLNLTYFNDSKSGNLISRLINDTYYLRAAIVKSVTAVIKDILVIIFLLGNMFYQSWSLTLFAFFAFPLAIWPIRKIGKSIRKITYEIQNEIAKFSNILTESIKGIRQVKAYNREEYEKRRAFKNINFIKKFFIRSAFISNRLSPLMEFIGSLAVAVSIYAGGVFVLNENMTTGQFMSFLVSLLLAYQPVKALGNLNVSVQEGLASAERIFLLLDTSIDKSEKHEEPKNIKLKGNIEYNNINFSYGKNNVLNNINLTIESGKKTAFVGLSGSGKSTFLNMIGLLDSITDGSIEIEGRDVSELSDNEVSKFRGEKIGFIFQSFFLLPGLTAQENVAEGLLYQGISRLDRLEKAKEVLDQVGLGDRLTHEPKELSGGQQQRVAIARALVQDPAFILADEPTGNLDKESGINILNILKDLNNQGKTVIMITHNQEHANTFNKVIELVDGKIVNS